MALTLTLFVPGLSQNAFAKNLKPVKDVATENEVIKLYNQALRYSKGERNVHARVVLEQAAKYDPTSVSAYIHAALSEIYHDLGNPDRAIQEGLLALRYDPSMKDMYYNLGLFCKDANRYEEGIQYLNKFVELSSGDKRTNAQSLIESLQKEQQKMGSFSNNDPDYLGQLMSEGRAHHWAASKVPLKVFIEPTSAVRGFKPEFVGIAQNAFITWYQASGKKLAFVFVNTLDEADINVEWTDGTLKVGDEKYERTKAGLTTTTRHEDVIDKARIQIRTVQAFTKNPEPVDRIKETCLHEIGHALGLNGHSTSTADIMYFGNSARQLPALTKRDKATMARLYSGFPQCSMSGVDTSAPAQANDVAPDVIPPQSSTQQANNFGNGQGGPVTNWSTTQLPSWSPPGAASGMPVQSWQSPASNMPPQGVAWPQQPIYPQQSYQQQTYQSQTYQTQTYPPQNYQQQAYQQPTNQQQTYQQQTNFGTQGYGAGSYQNQQQSSMPYATTPAQYATPTGQSWSQMQAPYYQQQGYSGPQSTPQGGYQQGFSQQGLGPQSTMYPAGAGPEQIPGNIQQTPMMQYSPQRAPGR